MIHPPKVPFDEWNPGPGKHQVLYLDVGLSSRVELLQLHPVSPVVRLPDPVRFGSEFRRLLHYWNNPDIPERQFMVSALTLQLLADIVHAWASAGREPRPASAHAVRDRYMEVVRT